MPTPAAGSGLTEGLRAQANTLEERMKAQGWARLDPPSTEAVTPAKQNSHLEVRRYYV